MYFSQNIIRSTVVLCYFANEPLFEFGPHRRNVSQVCITTMSVGLIIFANNLLALPRLYFFFSSTCPTISESILKFIFIDLSQSGSGMSRLKGTMRKFQLYTQSLDPNQFPGNVI